MSIEIIEIITTDTSITVEDPDSTVITIQEDISVSSIEVLPSESEVNIDVIEEIGSIVEIPVVPDISVIEIITSGGGGTGAVSSVNGRTGAVVLSSSDVDLENIRISSFVNQRSRGVTSIIAS